MSTIQLEDYLKLGTVFVRQADQLLQYKTELEQFSYSLEHKMSKYYSDEDIMGVFF